MTLRGDAEALESLPLKLIIVAVVASLSIVPAAEALDSMKTREFLRRAELQLDRIGATAHIVAIEGPGSSRAVDLDFSSDSGLAFAKLAIGDGQNGENMSAIVLELTNGARLVKLVENPPVWIRGPEDSGLVISSPKFGLRLTLSIVNSTYCVQAEVQPWIS
jgi:hypothetical protein